MMRKVVFLLLMISAVAVGQEKITIRLCNGVPGDISAASPLYIIDGKICPSDAFLRLDENRIESITVLKDSSALALCGNRGKNGVIVIKTKLRSPKDKQFQAQKNIPKDYRIKPQRTGRS